MLLLKRCSQHLEIAINCKQLTGEDREAVVILLVGEAGERDPCKLAGVKDCSLSCCWQGSCSMPRQGEAHKEDNRESAMNHFQQHKCAGLS